MIDGRWVSEEATTLMYDKTTPSSLTYRPSLIAYRLKLIKLIFKHFSARHDFLRFFIKSHF